MEALGSCVANVVVRHSKILRESERNPATEIERKKSRNLHTNPRKTIQAPLFFLYSPHHLKPNSLSLTLSLSSQIGQLKSSPIVPISTSLFLIFELFCLFPNYIV